MQTQDLILTSLEITAENAGDITLAVCQRFFDKCPDSKDLMEHIDAGVQGRMVEEVLRLLMVPDAHSQNDYLEFEVRSHLAYGVHADMYNNLLSAVLETVQSALGESWDEAFHSAWQERVDSLASEISMHA